MHIRLVTAMKQSTIQSGLIGDKGIVDNGFASTIV